MNFYVAGDWTKANPPRAIKVTKIKNSAKVIYCIDGPRAASIVASSGKFNMNNVDFPDTTPNGNTRGYLHAA